MNFGKLKSYFKQPVLCIVHFKYDVVGVMDAGKNKSHTVFAYVHPDCTTHDLAQLFDITGGKIKITSAIATAVKTCNTK